MKPAGAACESCPGRDAKCVPPERAAGGPARLVIVGEAPGWNEVHEGRPFVGKSGRMLERGLKTLGLSRSDVHWTNAILCDVGHDPKDQKAAAKACHARLQEELREASAPVIMPVGAWALQSTMRLSKKPQILKWRGSVSKISFSLDPTKARETEASSAAPTEKRTDQNMSSSRMKNLVGSGVSLVAPTVHPAFVMRSPGWGPLLEVDMARVGRLLEAKGVFLAPEEQEGRTIVIPKSLSELAGVLKGFRGDFLAADVETVGLGPYSTPLVCFGLSDGDLSVVIPWSKGRDGKERFWQDQRPISLVNDALRGKAMVTHNGPAFDHIVLQRYGVVWGEWQDTLIASHVLRSHLPKNLAHVVTTYVDVPPWKQLEDRTATIDRLWLYNGRDVLYTALAWREIRKELK